MKTFLAVAFFFRILTFAFANSCVDDDVYGYNSTRCNEVTPMSDFNLDKYIEKLKETYVTHARYGNRSIVCLELHRGFEKYSNGSLGYSYEFNGNGKPERGITTYTANCTSTEDSKQDGQFSFDCAEKFVLDKEYALKLLEESEEGQVDEEKEDDEEETEFTEEFTGEINHEFPLKVTVLSTDYAEYALIHTCSETLVEQGKLFVDNYLVLNKEKNAALPEDAKQKFKEFCWQEDQFEL